MNETRSSGESVEGAAKQKGTGWMATPVFLISAVCLGWEVLVLFGAAQEDRPWAVWQDLQVWQVLGMTSVVGGGMMAAFARWWRGRGWPFFVSATAPFLLLAVWHWQAAWLPLGLGALLLLFPAAVFACRASSSRVGGVAVPVRVAR